MSDTIYSFDTSAILDGRERWYHPDSFPSFWGKVDEVIEEGRFLAAHEVLKELEKREDGPVHTWAKEREKMFVPPEIPFQEHVARILSSHERLVSQVKERSIADPWVIAVAMEFGATVVTGEERGKKNHPKIPDVCAAYSIPCIKIASFIRNEGWRF